jgi:hypothetical protein
LDITIAILENVVSAREFFAHIVLVREHNDPAALRLDYLNETALMGIAGQF